MLYRHELLTSLLAVALLGWLAGPRAGIAAETSQSGNDAVEQQRPATVLLITSDELRDAWQPFAQWKTRCGKSTKIIALSQIKNDYTGDDVQQQIRACVLWHIDNAGTKWVVLGGDSQPGGNGHVPDRDTKHRIPIAYDDIPADVYYLSRDNWDANGDDVYGDWTQDREAISYGDDDVSIGRVPVRTAADVAAYTSKVIAYETQYPAEDFAERMTYTCPEPPAMPKLRKSWSDYVSPSWEHGEVQQFFSTETPWDDERPGDYDLTTAHWAKLINDRTSGKMHVHGHGFLPVWMLENRQLINAETVASLTNEDAYLVMTTVSCFTGQFDARQDPSITESMLRAPKRGAVVIVAPAREGVPVFADRRDMMKMVTEGKLDGTTRLLTQFWALGLSNNLTAGEALAAAKANMASEAAEHPGYHWCLSELNLLGDPTLDLRSGDPVTLDVEYPESLPVGQQDVSIATGLSGATVCLWKGNEIYEVATADADGMVTLPTDIKSPGQLLLTVSGPNTNSFAGEIEIE